MEFLVPIFRIIVALFVTIVWALLGVQAIKKCGLDPKDAKSSYSVKALAVGGIINVAILVTIVLMYKYLDKKDLTSLGFGFSYTDLIFSLVSVVLTLTLAYGTLQLLRSKKIIFFRCTPKYFGQTLNPVTFIIGALVLFIAAFQEEVLYRGYLLENLFPFGFVFALILSCAIFMVMHLLTNKINVQQAISWLLGGVTFVVVYVQSGSIWVSSIAHFAHNMANVLVLNGTEGFSLFTFDKPMRPSNKMIYYLILAASLILLTCVFYGIGIWKKLNF